MPFLNSNGVKLYYEAHGNGVPLILTHGYSSTSAMWAGQVPALSQLFRVIVWDMRGHGQSDYPPDQSAYSQALSVNDIAALLDHTCGHGSTAIVGGLSLGGYLSLAFYQAFPERVRGLLINDTGPGFKSDSARKAWNKTAYETAKTLDREGLRALEAMSPERSMVRHRDAKGLALAARGMLAQQDARVIESLPSIKVPCLIVVGADDTPFLAATEYMAKKIPGARKAIIPNAGHAVNIDQPERFLGTVLPFLVKLKNKDGGKALL